MVTSLGGRRGGGQLARSYFLHQGLKYGPRQWKHWVLTTGLPVNPQSLLLKKGIGQELSTFKMYSEFRETWVWSSAPHLQIHGHGQVTSHYSKSQFPSLQNRRRSMQHTVNTWPGAKWSESRSVVSDSLQLHGLDSPWNSVGQNTGVGSLSLLQEIFSNPGIEPRFPALQTDSLPAEPPQKPANTEGSSLSLLQRIFLTQESNWGLLQCRQILYQWSYQGWQVVMVIISKCMKRLQNTIYNASGLWIHR